MPRWPYRLPRGSGGDGVVRVRGNVLERLLHVGHSPVRVRSWRTREGYVHVRAESVDPALVEHPIAVVGAPPPEETPPAGEGELALAIERTRFSLAVEDDMGEFFQAFKRDPLLGPTIHHKPWVRPRRRPWPWEALCWAITKQLIESSRAAAIQRRIVRRWAPSHLPRGRSDAEAPRRLASPRRPLGRGDRRAGARGARLHGPQPGPLRGLGALRPRGRPGDAPASTTRAAIAGCFKISEIGPWTVQCLGLAGRGDPDSLPAGDLAYVKLVGHLAGLGRRATVEEVDEYFAPYAPFRGLAGAYALVGWHKAMGAGPPARLAA